MGRVQPKPGRGFPGARLRSCRSAPQRATPPALLPIPSSADSKSTSLALIAAPMMLRAWSEERLPVAFWRLGCICWPWSPWSDPGLRYEC